MPTPLPPLSLYVHSPWCVQKCPYCDFNSHALTTALPEAAYIAALLDDLHRDLTHFAIDRPLSSLFIGGGTPSLLSPPAIDRLLTGIAQQIPLVANAEITLEANPGTVEAAKFAEFKALGISRLSLGIQSFNDKHLQKLGRIHTARQAFLAVETAYQVGFGNVNLDLMFGLPQQTLAESQADMKTALSLNPPHLSFYQLTLEPNTYFHRFPPKLPDDELIFTMQQTCQHWLAEQGFEQYEVSAYARGQTYCQHNLNYWQFGDYLGIGAGAHGKLSLARPEQIIRTVKWRNPTQYLASTDKRTISPVPVSELPIEFLMNHLRLRRGFSLPDYVATTGLSATTLEPALTTAVNEGLLTQTGLHYRCTETGWNFLDRLLEKFIP
jgi:putative oxygen-independent coproporphyrinogen III oxidase